MIKLFSVGLINNNDYKAHFFSFMFSSMTTPPIIYSQDLYTKKKENMESKSFKS